MRAALLAAAATVLAAACGGAAVSSTAAAKRPQDAALQPSDARGLTRCSTSGTMAQTLATLQSTDPTAYQTTSTEWEKLKQAGATDAYFAIYVSDSASCGKLSSGTNAQPNARVLGNLVVQFKDSGHAQAAYKSGALGIDPSAAGGQGTKTGTATGLGSNSAIAYLNTAGLEFYIALWQRDRWLTYVITEGFSEADSAAITKSVNARL